MALFFALPTSIFRNRNHLLAHLLCLLLIFSTPVLAAGTCDTNFSLPIDAPTGNCAGISDTLAWDSRTLSNRSMRLEYEPEAGELCFPPPLRSPSQFLNRFLFASWLRVDHGPSQSLRVDPATLRPQALDLEIFPSIPISDQLSRKPSLSYSEDVLMPRQGRVHYAAPKQWRNHHGELVVMLNGTFQSRVALNQNGQSTFSYEYDPKDQT